MAFRIVEIDLMALGDVHPLIYAQQLDCTVPFSCSRFYPCIDFPVEVKQLSQIPFIR